LKGDCVMLVYTAAATFQQWTCA